MFGVELLPFDDRLFAEELPEIVGLSVRCALAFVLRRGVRLDILPASELDPRL